VRADQCIDKCGERLAASIPQQEKVSLVNRPHVFQSMLFRFESWLITMQAPELCRTAHQGNALMCFDSPTLFIGENLGPPRAEGNQKSQEGTGVAGSTAC
jgi:hypothetical protein